jgi:hypothetical protein
VIAVVWFKNKKSEATEWTRIFYYIIPILLII